MWVHVSPTRCFYLQVVGLLQLCPCLKYCGFSMTGILVIPITTASAPASSAQELIIPWFTWWRGLAESSSPLITATGPRKRERSLNKWTKGPKPEESYSYTKSDICVINIKFWFQAWGDLKISFVQCNEVYKSPAVWYTTCQMNYEI